MNAASHRMERALVTDKSCQSPRRSPRHAVMRRGLQCQAGMGTTSVLAIMGVAIFAGTFAFKVGPSYLENMTINKIVSTKVADPELMSGPKSKLMKSINNAFDQNNLWDLRAEDTIELKKGKSSGYTVTVKYEKRANLFGNVDVVTFFEKEATPGT